MKYALALVTLTIAGIGWMVATTKPADAVVYCQYIDYPPSCVA